MTELFNLVGESPSNVVGAYRGLVMLQETYNLDIIQMAAGTVSYHGEVFKVRILVFVFMKKNIKKTFL
jgi:hypothetical protein